MIVLRSWKTLRYLWKTMRGPAILVGMDTEFRGVIIEESLKDASVLGDVTIISTKVEAVTKGHETPWLKQWTLHTAIVPAARAEAIAEKISTSFDEHEWYADFKNDLVHYIIFPGKIFKVDRTQKAEYQAATDYGLTLGIPDYQLDFAPNVVQWER